MDFIIPIIILILLFITCSVCGYCCKRNKQGIVYGIPGQQNVPVTSTTTHTYQTNAPYPVMETPMPQPTIGPAPAGFAPHAAYPPTTPYPPAPGAPGPGYPPAGFHPMPMPMTGGFPGAAPYPAMPMPAPYSSPVPAYPANSAANQMPPSYAEAIQNRTVNEGYAQQAPYNPNYN